MDPESPAFEAGPAFPPFFPPSNAPTRSVAVKRPQRRGPRAVPRGGGGGGGGDITSAVTAEKRGTGVTAARRSLILQLQRSADSLEQACEKLASANRTLRRALMAKSQVVHALSALNHVHPPPPPAAPPPSAAFGGAAAAGAAGADDCVRLGGYEEGKDGEQGEKLALPSPSPCASADGQLTTAAAAPPSPSSLAASATASLGAAPPRPDRHLCGSEYQSALYSWHRALEAALEAVDGRAPLTRWPALTAAATAARARAAAMGVADDGGAAAAVKVEPSAAPATSDSMQVVSDSFLLQPSPMDEGMGGGGTPPPPSLAARRRSGRRAAAENANYTGTGPGINAVPTATAAAAAAQAAAQAAAAAEAAAAATAAMCCKNNSGGVGGRGGGGRGGGGRGGVGADAAAAASGSSAGSLGRVAMATTTATTTGVPALAVDAAADAVFRASVLGLFQRSPAAARAAAAAPPNAPITTAAAVALREEAESLEGEMRGISLEAFAERLKRIVAFATLELEHGGVGGKCGDNGNGENDDNDDDDDDGDDGGSDARLAALAREWILLYAAASKYAPESVDLVEAYDMQRRRLVGGDQQQQQQHQGAADQQAELAAFEQRSAKALAAARLSPAQRQSIADAFAFLQSETAQPLKEWRRAAEELASSAAASSSAPASGPPAGSATAPLDRLSAAVARCLVARSAFFLSVVSVMTPRQLLAAMVDYYPRAFRPAAMGFAALRAETEQQQQQQQQQQAKQQ